MSTNSFGSVQCEVIQEELSEFALGILTGERRSVVLDHVESCERCGGELQQLSAAADMVLQLAPEDEPTVGFEQRLALRLRASTGDVHPRRVRRIVALSSAAILTIVLGFGLGAILMPSTANDGASTANLTSATLSSDGQSLGEVYVKNGVNEWLFMTIDRSPWQGVVTCRVTMANGSVETLGNFRLWGGYGAWAARIDSSSSPMRMAQLVAPDGEVIATAHISL